MTDVTGTIVEIDGEYALIRLDETGCGRCHEEGGCGGHNLGKMLCSSPQTFRVLNPAKSPVGAHVTISIAEGAVRRTAVLAYGLPLLGLFLGAFCGLLLAGDAGAIAGSLVGLFGAWGAVHYVLRRSSSDRHAQPFIKA
jgi:sigma-E factor negative regulatory protein RseC